MSWQLDQYVETSAGTVAAGTGSNGTADRIRRVLEFFARQAN